MGDFFNELVGKFITFIVYAIIYVPMIVICILVPIKIYDYFFDDPSRIYESLLQGEDINLGSIRSRTLKEILEVDSRRVMHNKDSISSYEEEKIKFDLLSNFLASRNLSIEDIDNCELDDIDNDEPARIVCESSSLQELLSYCRGVTHDEYYGVLICSNHNELGKLVIDHCGGDIDYEQLSCDGRPLHPSNYPSIAVGRLFEVLSKTTLSKISAAIDGK